MKQVIAPFLLSICCCFPFCTNSTTDKTALKNGNTRTLFQSLYRTDILRLHLKTNLQKLLFDKAKKEKYPAQLVYIDENEKSINWTISVQARGNMRNKICALPPLKIDFAKADLKAAGLKRKFDDLKLVVHCKSEEQYDEFILREYLAYKLYHTLTNISFRVQLAHLTLEDVEGKVKTIETVAFLIENEAEMAARLNGSILSVPIKQDALDPQLFDQFCLFQYLIGNTDWYVLNKHNLKILKLANYPSPIAVPYDFDYAGLVNAPYATPQEKLPLKAVQERYYLGLCREKGALNPTIQLFKEKKGDLLDVVGSFPYLNDKTQKPMLTYLNDFFEILENPDSCERRIIEHCDRYVKVEQ